MIKNIIIFATITILLGGCDNKIGLPDVLVSNSFTQEEITQTKSEIESYYSDKAAKSGFPKSYDVEVQLIKSGEHEANGFVRVNIIGYEQTLNCNAQKDLENSGIIWSCE